MNEGLKNFIINVKPTMLKLKENKRLTEGDRKSIVQFYLEVINTIGEMK